MCPDTIRWRQEFLRITCQICYNPLCQICYKPSFCWKYSVKCYFLKKVFFLLACSWIIVIVSGNCMFKGIALNFSTWYVPRVLRRLRNACFLSARPGRRGMAPKVCRAAKQLSVIKSLQTQAVRNSRNRWRVSNMLKKHHHHHRHRHQNHITYHQFGIHFTISHRKISRMEWKYLWYTFAQSRR